jgi:hypothetical protein
MHRLSDVLVLAALVSCGEFSAQIVDAGLPQAIAPSLPRSDEVRIRELYRLAGQIEGRVWPGWGGTPAPMLLVTAETEFLTHHPEPPAEFRKIGEGLYARPRKFATALLATFPAFGPPSVIVIGEPENTEAKTSTPWLFVVMHEHFHQLQDGQPGLYEAMNGLGLAHGDKSGMWMLNYPFPYDKPELGGAFAHLRDLLLEALNQPDGQEFQSVARKYVVERKKFFALLFPDDRKYFSFQLWKEGIARYVQIRSAEAAAKYQPTPEYAALSDYESFESYARRARGDTLSELKKADLANWKRVVVYSFGGSEGLLLDRLEPGWKDAYFKNLFTLDPYFEK